VRRLSLIFAVGTIALAGCGGGGNETPVACLQGPAFYLERHPGNVRISDCLAQNQSGGDLATVGTAMVTAATRLNAAARAHPGGGANVQLGYLVGAATRGAGETEGIHADLIRRLTAAARYSPGGEPLPQAYRRAYRRGYEAGAARG
jgi:hypothetical protein